MSVRLSSCLFVCLIRLSVFSSVCLSVLPPPPPVTQLGAGGSVKGGGWVSEAERVCVWGGGGVCAEDGLIR